jgi:hypothetical protein
MQELTIQMRSPWRFFKRAIDLWPYAFVTVSVLGLVYTFVR